MIENFDIKKYVSSLSDEELCGEVLSWQFDGMSEAELSAFIKKNKVSSFYVNNLNQAEIKFIKRCIKESTKSPCLICADVERGANIFPETRGYSVSMMNLGAALDRELSFEIGRYTARLMRSYGVHLPLSPDVDICFNKNNPVTNTRAASDDTDTVLMAAGAYGLGMESEGLMGMVVKHFPGDGVDDRNQHFCTSVNSLSKEEWMNSYGRIYKELFSKGAKAVMVAHIALPWYDPTEDECGNMPATLSSALMKGLLRSELGFEGCIISDAMSMVGTAARAPIERLSVEFLRAGGDLVLFPEKDDHGRILEALRSGYLERERLIDAAQRVVKLKYELGLFEQREYPLRDGDIKAASELMKKAIDKSVTLVRNVNNTLPLELKPGAKLLVCTLSPREKGSSIDDFPDFADILEERGYQVIRMTNPSHYKINEIIDSMDAVFVCSAIDTSNCSGSSLRLGWNNMMTFWRGYIFKNKNVVFVSFGDPYKMHELPFLKTYVNAYIRSRAAAEAVIERVLGEKPFEGKSPVKL